MQLALHLGAERVPLALQLGVKIVVLAPVVGGLVIDLSGVLVENRPRITVRADG